MKALFNIYGKLNEALYKSLIELLAKFDSTKQPHLEENNNPIYPTEFVFNSIWSSKESKNLNFFIP